LECASSASGVYTESMEKLVPPPFWGSVSSDYDWCETNYLVTPYIAEFFNTVSSLGVVLAGAIFFRLTKTYAYGFRFYVASVGLTIIGLGSVAFHGTLKRWGQVLDEVPMLWSSLIFLWIVCCNGLSRQGESRWALTLAILMFCFGTVSTWFYFQAGFAYFIGAYILTVASIFSMTLYRVTKSRNTRASVYAYRAVAFYGGGFLFLWLPEQFFCGNRIHDTHESGLLSLPVPLHAFFHITSSIGPFCFLTHAAFEHLEQQKRRPDIVSEPSVESCGMISISVVKPRDE